MAMGENGTVAVVVGVGAVEGTGAALCRRFAREGLHVFAAGRTEAKLDAVTRDIAAKGGRVTPVIADTTVAADVEALLDRALEEGGSLDLVVYNAGNNQFRGLLDMDDAFFEEVWRICCFGGFLVGRESARRMVPRGGGTLIFTGATASIRARPPFTAFASAKAALRAVAHGMAREFGPKGLHVGHVIIDGVIDGEQVNSRLPQIKEQRGAEGMLQVDDIADAFWHLHSQPPSAWTLELDIRPHLEQF
jgi:NAD(P)-dependent dehydrogenase (short-subunit alcohol dehydrogenase family)